MKATNTISRLLVLKDQQGQPLRLIQTGQSRLSVVQNMETRRLEIVENHDLESHLRLLQTVELGTKTGPIVLRNIGTLSEISESTLVRLDPRGLKEDETHFKPFVKWSSGTHAGVVGILVLLALLMPKSKPQTPVKNETLVTINLEKPEPVRPKPADVPPAQRVSPKTTKVTRVVPRTNKSKPLLVNKTQRKFKSQPQKISANQPKSFQRLGSLGAISNAIKGSRNGIGSGLRGAGGGTGGIGRGAGMGRGNGTSGRGHDSGGGYEQALYGKGLIAGQVGAGGGGLGSGWGEGTRGSGGFGTKGKGGGHAGYGNSKVGSGASNFTYPVREDAIVEGGLDRDAVYMVIMKNLGQITYCYELGLQQKPNLRGRVAVDFTINPQGRVSHCSVTNSSLRSSQVETCMISKIKTWKFPTPVGGVHVDVNYPFALQRVSQN